MAGGSGALGRMQFWITLVGLALALSALGYRLLDGIENSALDLLLPAVVSVILLLVLRRSVPRKGDRT